MERGEELNGNEIITIEEIQKITGGDYEMAEQEHRTVRESLDYYSDDLTIENYCNYFGLDLNEILEFIEGLRYEPASKVKAKLEHPDFNLELDEVDQVPYVLRYFPFELFDKNADPDLEDFETFFNPENEEGGIDGDSTDY